MYNSNLQQQIQDVVENAISTSDYTELNKNIKNAVNTSIAQIGTSQNRFYQDYESTETSAQEELEHVEGEIVNGDARADFAGRQRAAREAEQQARWNSRQAQEARRMAAEAERKAEAARRKEERTRYRYYRQGSPQGEARGYGQTQRSQATGQRSASWQPNSRQPASGQAADRRRSRAEIVPISRRPAGRVAGTLLTVFGSLGVALSLAMFLAFGLALTFHGFGYVTYFSLLRHLVLPSAAVSGTMLWAGNRKRHRIKRFHQYVRQLRGRAYCSIRELSSHIGRSDRFVLKDLRKMISLGMFPEGHIDDQETCVMLNGTAYDQYRQAQNSYLARQRQEKLKDRRPAQERIDAAAAPESPASEKDAAPESSAQGKRRSLPPEVVQVLSMGKRYIAQIRTANDAIPGEIISNKLDRLENVIQKIYARIEDHPEQIDELDKFINYYLPTTLKLVNAYRDFDAQPVQGDNIQSSKKEIEATLDTIIYAFETLLDSLYEDDALDISTDISVLQTMFAQEGLTKGAFDKGQK